MSDSRFMITEERAEELADETAKRIYKILEKTHKEAVDEITRILASLGLSLETTCIDSLIGPDSSDDIAYELEEGLFNNQSSRYMVEEPEDQ